MKKSQMEIMGLAVIVILLVLAMLFVVRVVFVDEPQETKRIYTFEKLTSNTLNAMLKTNTLCEGLDINALLKDCSSGSPMSCGVFTSCEYVEDAIKEILDETITSLNKKYNFTATFELPYTQTVHHIATDPCQGIRQSTDPHPIRTSQGLLTVNLFVC